MKPCEAGKAAALAAHCGSGGGTAKAKMAPGKREPFHGHFGL
jgi:hypothetical protein